MNAESVIKYLKYLHEQAEQIAKQEVIEKYDVDGLRRDLEKLQTETVSSLNLNSKLRQAIRDLELNIREQYLQGSRKSYWSLLFRTSFVPSSRDAIQILSREAVSKDILNFRNRVDHILFSIEL